MASFKLYKDIRGEYRWSLISSKNNEIVAISSEGYSSKQAAINSITWTKTNGPNADINDRT